MVLEKGCWDDAEVVGLEEPVDQNVSREVEVVKLCSWVPCNVSQCLHICAVGLHRQDMRAAAHVPPLKLIIFVHGLQSI